ncbi:MAG: VOC family protein [Longibaculum sp.]
MKFNEVMHLSFYTDQMDKMRDFYENKLGLKAKIIMRYAAYKGKKKEEHGQHVQKRIPMILHIFLLN